MRDEFVDTCGLCDAPLRMGQRCACGDNWRAAQPAPAQPAIITPDVPPLDIHSAAARIWQALPHPDDRLKWPRCPYCGHEMDIDDMLACPDADLFRITTDEESACINCPSCDAEFWVAGGYTPHYHCAKTEDEL